MKDKTRVTREYMQDPGMWPHWPILPMRKSTKGLDGEYGVVVCNGNERSLLRVYKADMFAFVECDAKKAADLPREEFSSIEELLAAGWLVD